jgi:predicted metal-dependent enzyme (double-stranded beta helix superfamily)
MIPSWLGTQCMIADHGDVMGLAGCNKTSPAITTLFCGDIHPVRLSLSAESAAIQQYFSLTTNQRTVLSATTNQRNEQADYFSNFE